MARLVSDVENSLTKRMFDVLMQEVPFFKDLKPVDVEDMLGVFKVLNIKK
jgi:hypothetical protein